MNIRQAVLMAPGGEKMTTWLDVRPDLKQGIEIMLKDIPSTRWKVVKLYDEKDDAHDFGGYRRWENITSGQPETDELDTILDKIYSKTPGYMGHGGWVDDEEFNEYERPELKVALRRYSRHQTEQVLERLKDERQMMYFMSDHVNKYNVVRWDVIEIELKRLREDV